MGKPALRNRFKVSTTPIQMNGNARATMVARKTAWLARNSVMPITSCRGTQ